MSESDSLLRNRAAAFSMKDVGVIELVGPDARSFLQNLSTNDVRSLVPGGGQETFFTTHKARVVGHAIVHCLRDDAFLLTVESGRADAVFKHLDHHLISERVELGRRDWSIVRVLGPDSNRHVGNVPSQAPWQSVTLDVDTGAFVRRQGAFHLPGFDFVGPNEWLAAIVGDVPFVDENAMEVIRVESGWPRWGREMDENRFVVELGRIATAISYAKGCYLGQEPIVMARDRGQVNRQLFSFRSATQLPAGTNVMKGEVEQFKVTSCAFSPAWNAYVGLAYVYRGAGSAGATIALPGGGEAILSSLPMIPG